MGLNSTYTLMLQDNAERIRDFESKEEALEALGRFVETEPKLRAVAVIFEVEDGRLVGREWA